MEINTDTKVQTNCTDEQSFAKNNNQYGVGVMHKDQTNYKEATTKKFQEEVQIELNENNNEIVPNSKMSNNSVLDEEALRHNMTLLQKALYFRKHNPDKWESRQHERHVNVQESYGYFEEDVFLTNYYKRKREIQEEKRRQREQRKKECPKLTIKLEYKIATANSPRNKRLKSNDFYSKSAEGVTVFDETDSILDFFRSDQSENPSKLSQLVIIVKDAEYINNILQDTGYMKECKVKCYIRPESTKCSSIMRSKYVYCDSEGTCRWNHVFVLKGLTAEELSSKYVILEVIGKHDNKKITVGRTILAGKNAKILSNSMANIVPSTTNENEHWSKALASPGSRFKLTKALKPHVEEFGGNLTSLMRKEMHQHHDKM